MSTDKRASGESDQPANSGISAATWPAEMCRELIQLSPWPMFVLDCQTHQVVEANPAAIHTYQMDLETLKTEGVVRTVPPHRLAELKRVLDKGLSAAPRDFFSEHILPDGNIIPVEVRSFPLLWNNRPVHFFQIRNLTSKYSGDSSSAEFSGRSPEGRISSSAVHDFNNLLTVVLAVAEQLQEGEGNPEQQVDLIAKTVRSAQELAKQRLSLSGRQMSHNERLDLNAVLTEQEDILRGLLGKQCDLVTRYDPSLLSIFGDAEQWREVVLNLAVNARDAMTSGGTLTIATGNATIGSENRSTDLAPGNYVKLIIEDTGQGMTEETRRQAFHPYFSTKSRTSNSGLGLSSVATVVQHSGGVIHMNSKVGHGTRFEIFIPPIAGGEVPLQQRTHILLVEDSIELRRMIQVFLTGRGYDVVSCGTAEAALKWAASHKHSVDIILADLMLPDLYGSTLVEQLLLLHPASKVIFMSGYPEAAQKTGPLGGTHLEKPFSLHKLAEAIGAVMKE